jgi:PilZ domain
MLQDRRTTPRRSVNSIAKMRFDGGLPPRDCVVMDISEGGARLLAADGAEVPEEFMLLLDSDADAGCRCRVVWRLDNEIGAEFVEAIDK